MRAYRLYFNGYWIKQYFSDVTDVSGVYIVYRCLCDDLTREVVLKELLYIGKATNLRRRIAEHENDTFFKNQCNDGEILCYSVANVDIEDLDIVENALIFAQKPRLNDDLKDSFKYDVPVAFRIEGRCSKMKYLNFTIENKEEDA